MQSKLDEQTKQNKSIYYLKKCFNGVQEEEREQEERCTKGN